MKSEMLKQEISLDGEWNLYWCDIAKGSLEEAISKATTPCLVPGDVHTALVNVGAIKDPLIDKNNEECRWVEEKEFWYVKEISLKLEQLTDQVVIRFDGLDLTADIWVNHQYIGSHNNAFYGVEFDITKVAKEGVNRIVVRIDQGLHKVADKPLEMMDKMWNNDQPYRVWMRKPQYVYGWDWTIWLATCGITASVSITSYQKAYIQDAYVYEEENQTLKEGQALTMFAELALSQLIEDRYQLRCELFADQRYDHACDPICRVVIPVDQAKLKVEFEIDSVNLWWPNGSGRPYLYLAVFTLLDSNGNVVDSMKRSHGVRTIGIREEKLNDQEQGFTFMINGEPIFCKGANYVPSDCLYGRITKERTIQIIQKAADANMNMLRVWGGGLYESEAFMTTCDELGLLVWHDFMYACGFYPDHDEEFYEEIKKEAIAAILRLRNHSSLIGWSGNNEIQEMYHAVKQWNPELPWYGRRIYEELLPELVSKYQKNVIYRESSPYGGKDSPAEFEVGDQHVWHFTHRPNYEHYMDLWRFTDFNLKFLSEFGIIGAMSMASVQKCIGQEHQDVDSEVWLHHSNTTSNRQLLNMVVDRYFGEYHRFTLAEFVLRSQVLQAEIIRHIYDEFRARKFVCSGLLFWTLGDSYGIHNWSLIDYYLEEKPAYYYLKRSMAPLAIAIRGYEVQNFEGMEGYRNYFLRSPEPLTLWVMNDKLTKEEIQVEYKIMTFAGESLKEDSCKKIVAANSSENVMTVPLEGIVKEAESTFLYVRLYSDGKLVNENRYFFAPYKELDLSPVQVRCKITKQMRGLYELELLADSFVWMLHLDKENGECFSDNDFDLIPGEVKRVFVQADQHENYIPKIQSLNPYLELKPYL